MIPTYLITKNNAKTNIYLKITSLAKSKTIKKNLTL